MRVRGAAAGANLDNATTPRANPAAVAADPVQIANGAVRSGEDGIAVLDRAHDIKKLHRADSALYRKANGRNSVERDPGPRGGDTD